MFHTNTGPSRRRRGRIPRVYGDLRATLVLQEWAEDVLWVNSLASEVEDVLWVNSQKKQGKSERQMGRTISGALGLSLFPLFPITDIKAEPRGTKRRKIFGCGKQTGGYVYIGPPRKSTNYQPPHWGRFPCPNPFTFYILKSCI